MRVENRPVYIAEDGNEFDSEEMCLLHEFRAKMLANFLAETNIRFDSFDEEQFVNWLDRHVAIWKPFR